MGNSLFYFFAFEIPEECERWIEYRLLDPFALLIMMPRPSGRSVSVVDPGEAVVICHGDILGEEECIPDIDLIIAVICDLHGGRIFSSEAGDVDVGAFGISGGSHFIEVLSLEDDLVKIDITDIVIVHEEHCHVIQ